MTPVYRCKWAYRYCLLDVIPTAIDFSRYSNYASHTLDE